MLITPDYCVVCGSKNVTIKIVDHSIVIICNDCKEDIVAEIKTQKE